MKRYFVALLLILGTMSPAAAQINPKAAQKAAWQAFQDAHGDNWQIHWNERTGVPGMVFHGLSAATSGSPEQIARAFLSRNADLFRMKTNLEGLKHIKTLEYGGVSHVTFQQMYKGLPVEDAIYLVHVREGGRVDMANGSYYPDIAISSIGPNGGEGGALSAALQDVDPSAALEQSKTELVILPTKDDFRVAWKIELVARHPDGTWQYFIDAQNGQILRKINLISPIFSKAELTYHAKVTEAHNIAKNHAYRSRAGSRSAVNVTGSGTVYLRHPDLDAGTTFESLPRLENPIDGIVYTLNGSYAAIRNDAGNQAASSNGNFYYQPTDPHFDEVNLYYHIDHVRSIFWNSLNMNEFSYIEAHANTPYDPAHGNPNAWYQPALIGLGELYFNPAVPTHNTKDFAKEDKVIYHEYTHAIIDRINDNIHSNNLEEEGAISEGTPDYFAGAATGRTKILEYVLGSPDRDMANPVYETYSEYLAANPEPHRGGEFWSAVLWNLRTSSGIESSKVDFLVFGALYRLDSTPTFSEFRSAIISEDLSRYAGLHDCAIKAAFAARGIGSACPPLSASIWGPSSLSVGQTGTWTAAVSNGTLPYSYNWQYKRVCITPFAASTSSPISNSSSVSSFDPGDITPQSLPCDVWYSGGTGSTFTKGSSSSITYQLKLTVTDSSSPVQTKTTSRNVTWTTDGSLAIAGTESSTAMETAAAVAEEILPEEYAMHGNAPNPFSRSTEIRFDLPESAHVKLAVYNMLGQEVRELVNADLPAGFQHVTLSTDGLSSGVYLYRITAGTFTETKRMVIAK